MTINYLAVLVAAIASFALGALWYGPVFGKVWMRMMNFTPESLRGMKMTPKKAMTWGFISALVMAWVLARMLTLMGAIGLVVGMSAALGLAFFLWLGFIATVSLGIVLWEGKPFKLYLFNIAYQLVSLLVMAAILASWPA